MSQNWVGHWERLWSVGFWQYSITIHMPHNKPLKSIFGERLMISLFLPFAVLLAFIGMLFYPLSDKKVKEIIEQLDQKRAKSTIQ
jgi:GPH family glycoside/pentoside/hexuronide:cation symporter